MKSAEFIEKVKQSHHQYMTVVSALSQEQLCQVNTNGDWSVKDIIAHITWYEKEMVEVIKERALRGSPLWEISLDQRNQIIHEEVKDLPLSIVLAEADQVFQSLMILLNVLNDEELTEPKYFQEMPSDWIPWEVIASNTFEHYPIHVDDIRRSFRLDLNQEFKQA